jgi:hypothetical protein
MSLTQLIFGLLLGIVLPNPGIIAFLSQWGRSRSSTKVKVTGWPATVFPSASVNDKVAHRLSISATATRYGQRSVSDVPLD